MIQTFRLRRHVKALSVRVRAVCRSFSTATEARRRVFWWGLRIYSQKQIQNREEASQTVISKNKTLPSAGGYNWFSSRDQERVLWGGFMGTKKWKEKTCWQADEWLYVLVRSPNTDSDLERADGELLHKHKTIQLQKETIFKEEIKRNIDFSPPPRETNERSLKAQCLTGYWETLEVGVW